MIIPDPKPANLIDLSLTEPVPKGDATNNTLHWDDTKKEWVAGPSSQLPPGTADQDVLTWDAATNSWISKSIPGPSGPSLPTTANANDILRWDSATKQWKPVGFPVISPGSIGIPDGHADKDILQWDQATSHWTLSQLPTIPKIPNGVDDMDTLSWDTALGEWVTAADELGGETNINGITDQSADGGVLTYNQTDNEWNFDHYLAQFKGMTHAGDEDPNTGVYTPSAWAEKKGNIWINKNNTPPTFEMYDGTGWNQIDPAKSNLPFLNSLVDVSFSRLGNGFSLVWDDRSGEWTAMQAPAIINDWFPGPTYAKGAIVYDKGEFWRCNVDASRGNEPGPKTGSVMVWYVGQWSGSNKQIGPVQPDEVRIVASLSNTPPTVTAATDRPHVIVDWVDKSTFQIWHNQVSFSGFSVTATWALLAPATAQTVISEHRPGSNDIGAVADNKAVVWIYGTNQAQAPQTKPIDWDLLPIRTAMSTLYDVDDRGAVDGSMLLYHSNDKKWHAHSIYVAPPASSTSPGAPGQMAYDATHFFICTGVNQWIRVSQDHGSW